MTQLLVQANPFRQGMLFGEFLADPFLAFKGISSLLKAGSRTDTPATRSTDLVPVETEQQPVRFNTTGDISLSDLPRSEVTGLPVLRTEVTQRMATQEEIDAFMRGDDPSEFAPGRTDDTIEGEFTSTPGTAPEGDEANQLFDAASQARALDDVEDTQQATPAQPRTPALKLALEQPVRQMKLWVALILLCQNSPMIR